ncbi:MAG TPA: hypothetical protein VIE68_02015 [Gemmatimonadota bacterium]
MTGLLVSLAALWVLLAAVWVALWPLFVARGAPPSETEVERQELEAEKARLLQEIHELELDYQTGKLSDEDHRTIEARLKGKAVEVMQRLDALSPVESTREPGASGVLEMPEMQGARRGDSEAY